MAVVRQAGALLLAALFMSRGLFAQDSVLPPPDAPAPPDVPSLLLPAAADQAHVTLRPIELRYVQQETLLIPQTSSIKGLYVNAWAFGSPKLWHLGRLADETEINAFVVDVKDDTGCLLYPSAVPTAQQIGANACTRAKDAKARLDTLAAHGIYAIARIVVAKDPLLAERSEEHTSELQSRSDIVCRLLLEKKKKTKTDATTPRNSARARSVSYWSDGPGQARDTHTDSRPG